MWYHIRKMTQMTMKLLLRNKGFLFFGIVLPILATLIINVKNTGDSVIKDAALTEMKEADAKVAYLNDYKMFPVKIYDSSESEISTAFLEHLANEQIFQMYRVDASGMTEEEIFESAKWTAKKDKVGAIIILSKEFTQGILSCQAYTNESSGIMDESMKVYETGEDERFSLLTNSVEGLLTQYVKLAQNADSLEALAENVRAYETGRQQVTTREYKVASANKNSYMDVDYEHTGSLGYAFAILSVSFLFSGILILGTIMKEKQNLVYTRILLTKAGSTSYMISKFCIIAMVTLIQTGVIGMSYVFLVRNDVGFTLGQLMYLVFFMGLIFNSLSVCIGICVGSVLPATYMSFFAWVMTALLGGLYFDISGGSELMQRVAMLMPQRWMLKGAQMFMSGNSFAYSIILGVTAAYLIVILVIGILGLKLNQKE